MFSLSIGLARWFGNEPSSSKYIGTTLQGRRFMTSGRVAPAMPFPASITSFKGLTFFGAMKEST